MTSTAREQLLATMYGPPLRARWATETATTMNEKGVEPPGPQSAGSVNILVVSAPFAGVTPLQAPFRAPGAFVVEAGVEDVGLPGDCTVTSAPWPILWSEPDVLEPTRSRGTFSVRASSKPLFTLNLDLAPGSLRRWKPKVTLDRRTLDRMDDA